ncbi:MAG TPA: hypothetical protein PKJ47_10600 [Candidatus Limiplasma sp.]|nr:hypothetical protein [Candidatus Limiplasma sp.]
MSMNFKALTELTDEELIKRYDETARNTSAGLNYYTEEIARRRNEKSNKLMIKYTMWITIMTAIMMLSTIVNIVIAVYK